MGTYDVFDDDQEEINKNQGVLGGAAFDEVERIKEKPSGAEGYEFSCLCNQCATAAKITIPWSEIITCMGGAVPLNPDNQQPWTMDRDGNGGVFLRPSVFCKRCGTQFPIVMYPQKAAKFVSVGVSMRVLNPQQVEQQLASVRQHMQAYRR